MALAYAGLRDIPLRNVVQKPGNISMAAPTGGSWTDLFTWFSKQRQSQEKGRDCVNDPQPVILLQWLKTSSLTAPVSFAKDHHLEWNCLIPSASGRSLFSTGPFFFHVSELPKTMQEVYVQAQPRHQNNAGLCHPWSDAQTPAWLCPQPPQAGGGKVPEGCLSPAEHGCIWDAAPHIYHVGRAIPSEQKHLEIKAQSNTVGPTMPAP